MSVPAPPAPVPLEERAAGPDLARGLALLGIGLANLVAWLHGEPWTVLLKQAEAAPLDRAVDVLLALSVDNRLFPLFALLFGYGLGILHRRSLAAGERPGRFVLRMLRRHLVLLAIGLAHATFLFSGDILVAYAMIGMLCVGLLARHRAILAVGGLMALAPLGTWGWADGVSGLGGGDGYALASAATYAETLLPRAREALVELATAPVYDLGLLAPMAIGALAARPRLLEDVPRHRAVLRPTAAAGCATGLLGALPLTAVLVLDPRHEVLDSPIVLGILGTIHQLSGLFGAIGLAAACALLAERLLPPRPRDGDSGTESVRPGALVAPARAVTALGTISLTAYVALSLEALLLFPPYTLDLGARLGTAPAALLVTAGWLLLVGLAELLRRHGRRGPLEALLRRLARPRGAGAPVG